MFYPADKKQNAPSIFYKGSTDRKSFFNKEKKIVWLCMMLDYICLAYKK